MKSGAQPLKKRSVTTSALFSSCNPGQAGKFQIQTGRIPAEETGNRREAHLVIDIIYYSPIFLRKQVFSTAFPCFFGKIKMLPPHSATAQKICDPAQSGGQKKSKRLTGKATLLNTQPLLFRNSPSLFQNRQFQLWGSALKLFYAKGTPENRSPSLFTCRTLRFRKERSLSDYFT